MELDRYIDDIHAQLDAAARASGDEARELAARLTAPLDSAIRLAIQDALAAAAEEITVELAPGSVELRLRGREPHFAVTLPEPASGETSDDPGTFTRPTVPAGAEGDEAIARVNVRMPEGMKARVDAAADREMVSTNAWLVRAAAAQLDRAEGGGHRDRRAAHGAQRYQGWAR